MRFFHVVAVFTATGVLTTANPIPDGSIFSDLSNLSSDFYNPDSAADLFLPLEDSSLLDFDDGTSLFTQDMSIAGDFCSAPNGPVRKRDNMKCDSSPSNSPSINIPQLPNLLEPQKSQAEDGSFIDPLSDAFRSLPADDSVTIQFRLDDGRCLEYPYIHNVCCNGPWLGRVPGIIGTVYSEIRACYYSK